MSRQRRFPSHAIIAVVLVASMGCGASEQETTQSRPTKLVLANVHATDYPTAAALRGFAEAVSRDPMLADRVTVDLQLGGVLGNEKDVLEKLTFGGVQLYAGSVAPLAEFSDAIGVLTLPYLFRDAEHYWAVLEGPIGDELLASVEESGFVGLAWYDAGARSFYNRKRPVRTLDELSGLKIRVQRSETMRRTVESLGATPIALGFNEVYTSLHTGNIDGAENNLPSFYSERHYEVAKYYTLDRHSMIPDLLLIRRASWEALSEAEQAALRQLALRSSQEQRQLWNTFVSSVSESLAEAGVAIVEVTDPEAFRAAATRWSPESALHGDLAARIRSHGSSSSATPSAPEGS